MTCIQRNIISSVAGFALVFLAAWFLTVPTFGTARAQPPQTDRAGAVESPDVSPRPVGLGDASVRIDDEGRTSAKRQTTADGERKLSRLGAIGGALRELREAKNDDEKQAARAGVRKLLVASFDDDMNSREKQVQEIEARIEKLRKKYQERLKLKDQIIDLHLKVLENDAAGLGFPNDGPMSDSTESPVIDEQAPVQNLPRTRSESTRKGTDQPGNAPQSGKAVP